MEKNIFFFTPIAIHLTFDRYRQQMSFENQ